MLILALALGGSTFLFAVTVLVEIIDNKHPGALTEVPPNTSQVLTAIFSGIIGIIGSYVGYRQANRRRDGDD